MTEKEWLIFNNILLEIYYQKDLRQFGETCLNLIKILVPYWHGYFVVIDENGNIDEAQSCFKNLGKQAKKEYLETYFKVDYLLDMCYFSKSMAFRDTDLMSDEKRKASKFYRQYLLKQGLDLGCGIIIMQNGHSRVFLNLLRKKGEADVTDHELEILQLFLPHFEKNVYAYLQHDFLLERTDVGSQANLSARELEIVRLVKQGCSNQEIGTQLGISTATVKKHLSNIFEKMGINRRTQLFYHV